MATTVKIDDLPEEISRIMSEVEKEAHRASDQTVDNISKEALKAVQKPPGAQNEKLKGGHVSEKHQAKEDQTAEFETEYTIYAGEYRLSHLLENGHLTLKGERTQAILTLRKVRTLPIRKSRLSLKRTSSRRKEPKTMDKDVKRIVLGSGENYLKEVTGTVDASDVDQLITDLFTADNRWGDTKTGLP